MPDQDEIAKFLAQDAESLVDQHARKYGVDPSLAKRILKKESALRPDVLTGGRRSKAGAIGPMQLMPGTAKELGVDPSNYEQNIEGGVKYLAQMQKQFGDPAKAAAAYNAGPGAVQKYGGVPPYAETQDYVKSVAGGDDIAEFLANDAQAAPIIPAKPFTRPAKPGPIRNPQRGPIAPTANPFATNQGATGFQEQAQQAYERTQGLGQGRPQGLAEAANQFKQAALKGFARIPQGISESLQMPVSEPERRLAQTLGPSATEDIRRREGGLRRTISQATEPVVKKIEQAYPVDPNDQSWMTQKVPAAAGGLVPMIASALLGRGLGAKSSATSALSGAAQSAGEVSDRLNKAGIEGPQRSRSAALATATGATEALGLGRALDKIGAKRAIMGRVGNVTEDVAQEYGQEYLGDVNAKLVGQYDKNASLSPISSNKLEAAALGGVLGGTLQGAGALASRRPGAPLAVPPVQPEPQQPLTRVDPLSVDARGKITGGRTPIRPDRPQQTQITPIPTGNEYAKLTSQPEAAASPAQAIPAGNIAGIRVIAENERIPASQRRNVKTIVVKQPDGSMQSVRAMLPEGMTPGQARQVLQGAQKAQAKAATPPAIAARPTTEPLTPEAPAQVNPRQVARNENIQKAHEDSIAARTRAEGAMREGRHDEAIKAYNAEADALRALRDQIPNKSRGGRVRRVDAGERLTQIQSEVKAAKIAQRQAVKAADAPTADLTGPIVPDAPQTARMPEAPNRITADLPRPLPRATAEIPRPVDAAMTEPTNRLRNADYPGGELQRTAGLRPEGQPIEVPADRMQENTNRLPGAEYAGGEVRTYQQPQAEGQPVDVSRRPPAPPRPAGRFRPGSVPGRFGPAAMTAENAGYPRSRMGLTQEGARVGKAIKAGQEQGDYGKLASFLYKGRLTHAHDSFLQDFDVKSALGFQREEGTQNDVSEALKSDISRLFGVESGDVSRTFISPETLMRWADVRGLGPDARAKLRVAIEKYQRGVLDDTPPPADSTDSQQPEPVPANRDGETKPVSDYKRFEDANKKAIDSLMSMSSAEAATEAGQRRVKAINARLRKSAEQMGVEGHHVDAIMTTAMGKHMDAAGIADARAEDAAPAPEARPAQVQFMITSAMRRDLANLGYTRPDMDKMKPQEAADIIAAGTKKPRPTEPTPAPKAPQEAPAPKAPAAPPVAMVDDAATPKAAPQDMARNVAKQYFDIAAHKRFRFTGKEVEDAFHHDFTDADKADFINELVDRGALPDNYRLRAYTLFSNIASDITNHISGVRRKWEESGPGGMRFKESFTDAPEYKRAIGETPPVAETRPRAVSEAKAAPIATGDAGKAAPKAKRAAKTKPAPEAAKPAAPEQPAAKSAGRIDGKDVTPDEMAVYDAMVKAEPRFADNAAASFSRARQESALSKEAFDKAAISLAEKEIIGLHAHDFPQSLSPEGRAYLVQGNGQESIAGSLRNPRAAVERAGEVAAQETQTPTLPGLEKLREGYEREAVERDTYADEWEKEHGTGRTPDNERLMAETARDRARAIREGRHAILEPTAEENASVTAKSRAQKEIPRVGLTPAQADYLRGKVAEVKPALEADDSRAITIRVPDDGQFTVRTPDQANKLLERIGKPIVKDYKPPKPTKPSESAKMPADIGQGPHNGETEGAYPLEKAQAGEWGGNRVSNKEWVSDGSSLIRVGAMSAKQREPLLKRSGDNANAARANIDDLIAREGRNLNEKNGQRARINPQVAVIAGDRAQYAAIEADHGNPAIVSAQRLKTITDSVDFDEVRVAGKSPGSSPVGFFKDGELQALLMPMRVDDPKKIMQLIGEASASPTEAPAKPARKPRVKGSVGKLDREESGGTTLGSGFGALQGMFKNKPPTGADLDAWMDRMGGAIPETMTDAQVSRFDDLVNRAADAAEAGNVREWRRLSRQAERMVFSRKDRAIAEVSGAMNATRSLMASGDLSAPLRQGAILTLPPSQWGRAGRASVRMFQALSAGKYERLKQEIQVHPDFDAAEDAGLYLATNDSGRTRGEEDFLRNNSLASRIVERMPILAHSERAYKMYLDSLRMDTFAKYKHVIEKGGGTDEQKAKALKAAAEWINVATGRGSLGKKFDESVPLLSTIFFAPRYTASRIQVLSPTTYAKNLGNPANRQVFRRQMSELFQSAAVLTTTAALAKYGLGATVNLDDPESPDWLKIKIGDTRYDVGAGLQQIARLGARIGKYLDTSARGTEKEQGAASDKMVRGIKTFGRSKLGPVPSFFVDWLNNWTNVIGERHTPGEASTRNPVIQRITPLLWADMVDAYREGGAGKAARFTPGVFGVGVQDYDVNKKRKTESKVRVRPTLPKPKPPKGFGEL